MVPRVVRKLITAKKFALFFTFNLKLLTEVTVKRELLFSLN